jgi:hypothetical protein
MLLEVDSGLASGGARGPARPAGPSGLGPGLGPWGRHGSRGRAGGSQRHADGRLDRVGGACGTNLADSLIHRYFIFARPPADAPAGPVRVLCLSDC